MPTEDLVHLHPLDQRDDSGGLVLPPAPITQLLREVGDQLPAHTALRVLDVGCDQTRTSATLPCAVIQLQGPDSRRHALVSRDVDGRAVLHPIGCAARALRGPLGSGCARAQGWIFGTSGRIPQLGKVLQKLHRRGDVALSPYPLGGLRAPFPPLLTLTEQPLAAPVRLAGTHWLVGARMIFCDQGAVMLATDPVVEDRTGRLPPLSLRGTFRIHRAQRAGWGAAQAPAIRAA